MYNVKLGLEPLIRAASPGAKCAHWHCRADDLFPSGPTTMATVTGLGDRDQEASTNPVFDNDAGRSNANSDDNVSVPAGSSAASTHCSPWAVLNFNEYRDGARLPQCLDSKSGRESGAPSAYRRVLQTTDRACCPRRGGGGSRMRTRALLIIVT